MIPPFLNRSLLLTCIIPILVVMVSFNTHAYAQWYQDKQAIMGTLVQVELWSESPVQAQQAISAVMSEMHRIDALMSPFKKDSELSYINTTAIKQPARASHEMLELIRRSIEISVLSKGVFDISFASIGNLYDYRRQINPDAGTIQQRLGAINYKNIILDHHASTIYFKRKDMSIDLGGIAKGHAVDNAIRILEKLGIKMAMVSAGGDSRIISDRLGRPWMVGIKHPRISDKSSVVLPISSTAVSTSGDYERFFIKNGTRFHHIISPKNGKSAQNSQSATIIGPESTTCDALSTTIFILGYPKGIELIESIPDYDAIIIDEQGKLHYSSGLLPP